jgi:hypothetical protein
LGVKIIEGCKVACGGGSGSVAEVSPEVVVCLAKDVLNLAPGASVLKESDFHAFFSGGGVGGRRVRPVTERGRDCEGVLEILLGRVMILGKAELKASAQVREKSSSLYVVDEYEEAFIQSIVWLRWS